MAKKFEFRVCQVQDARVTYVNGKWQGKMALSADHIDEAVATCPEEWDYLQATGADGWDLAAALGGVGGEMNSRMLYLRRELA
jgi:hypothetical protein